MGKIRTILFIGFVISIILVFSVYFHFFSRGYVFFVRDYFTGGQPVLKWTRFGYPAIASWKVFSNKLHDLKIIFYQTSIPAFKIKSPPVPLPVTVHGYTTFPVILVRKEWFPLLIKKLRPGSYFTVKVEFLVRKRKCYYRVTKDVRILFTGSVMQFSTRR